jgi:M6 family metalloprotease-like protein
MARKAPRKILPVTGPLTGKPKAPSAGSVQLAVPRGSLFVGSYHRIRVRIDPKSGVSFDDLDFQLPDGLKAGLISPSRDSLFKPKAPVIMLCCGYRPGTYIIQAWHRPTNTLVGEAKFRLDALWKDGQNGPSFWFTGEVKNYAMGASWGGGAPGPQNYNVHPATGTRRIAILMVDTSTTRFTNDAPTIQGFKDRWMNETINGVNYNGSNFSVRAFYREESYNTFDISAQVFGPVQLPGTWDDYFDSNGGAKGSYWQACVTAGDGVVDYTQFDTLVCASQPAAGPLREAWPVANGGMFTTSSGDVSLGVISLSNEWGLNEQWQIHESLPHELGHNLGLPDLYGPDVAGRMLGSWDLMDWNPPLPYVTIGQRLQLGFVKPAWVKAYDFASHNGLPVDETVTLQAIETGQPPAGRFAGIEVRVADGWNYYFEYRKGQMAQEGDRQLPTDSAVLGTDMVSPPWNPPFARPEILLLGPGGDGPVLTNGQGYKETDFTDPMFPSDFRADVSGIDGTKADVRIRYGANGKPDPSIRPWPAGPGREWQSPDIEVKNMKNQADPSLFNLPWVGHDNTVVASIKNSGALDAPGVVANFYVKDYTVSGAPESPLGTDVHDINAGQTVEFTTHWQPPSDGHFCMIVRIPLYQNPMNPAIVETTELNNLAQSNYTQFISASASPPSRERAVVKVGNPYNLPTRAFLRAGHSNPMYRTYLGNTWVALKANEVKDVEIMFEYAPDNLTRKEYSGAYKENLRKFEQVPNQASFVALLEDPRDTHHHQLDVIAGANARVLTGRAIKFSRFDVAERTARGTVVTVSDGKPLASGRVLVRTGSGTLPHIKSTYQEVTLTNGSFSARIAALGEWVDAYCLPSPGYGDCESAQVKLK